MKYIKKYQLFESNLDREDIDDILLELSDIGLNIEQVEHLKTKHEYIKKIIISSINEVTSWDLIKDTILRLVDYLDDNFISLYFIFDYEGSTVDLFYEKKYLSSLDTDLSNVSCIKKVAIKYKSRDI